MTDDAAALAAVLPEYEVGDELGRGGFGVVRAGRHRQLDRLVAIKELPPFLAGDAKVRARFVAEARVLAALAHPHIVPIYDYVERDGICLLVMEKLPGGTVWDQFTGRGYTVQTATAVAMVTCDALHYAHSHGVLHRDIKPENLMFAADGSLKVTDFGIARVVGGGETLATQAGEILGTPAYMAPEQAEGSELGPQADVFATGVMLYELLAGALPYSEEGGALAIVYRHVYEDPIPLREAAPEVPAPLADVTMRALARHPDDRFATTLDFGVALGEAATGLWGPGWLERAEVAMRSPGPILTTSQRPSGDASAAGAPPAAGEPATRVLRRKPTKVGSEAGAHVPAARPEIALEELVPVGQVIEKPPSPLAPALAALALVLLAVLLAFVGIGSPERETALAPGAATVAGADAAGRRAVPVDLVDPIEVRVVQRPAGLAGDAEVQLGFSVAGIPLIASDVRPLTAGPDGETASLDAAGNRFLAGGEVTAELRFLVGGEIVVRHQFALDPAQSPLITVPGVATGVLVLFLLAYSESFLKVLRRGRRRWSAFVAMGVVGAGWGLVAVLAAWLLGAVEPAAVG
ncbi:MAG: serine/threonine-protein kinase, partial [Acidimicrobiales bacterium]